LRKLVTPKYLQFEFSLATRVVDDQPLPKGEVQASRTPELVHFFPRKSTPQGFPQKLYHLVMSEPEVDQWDHDPARGQAALFHLGALSGLITGIEMPGWTRAQNYRLRSLGCFSTIRRGSCR
jgi:DNA helicase-2/ATP-dependent DNA helicase PcrA